MAPLMILGSVPLYNIFAVIVLTVTAPSADGRQRRPDRALAMKTLRGIITNPIIIGILAGLLWSVLGIPQPKIFAATIKNIAVLATPLGLMAMGSAFDLTKAKAEVAPALAASIIKLMLLVAAFLPLAVLLGFRNQELVALLVMLGSASTVSCYIMARNMGHEGTLTSSTVMMTTFGACGIAPVVVFDGVVSGRLTPPQVIERWKASGPGWQTRMAEALEKSAPKAHGAAG